MQYSQNDFHKKLLGRKGEDLAVKFLKKQRYKIIERNFKCTYGEADIIARQDDCYVFIEVKARASDTYGRPLDAVDYVKQNKYKKIAEYYFYIKNIFDVSGRFDVIEILPDGSINHIENAF